MFVAGNAEKVLAADPGEVRDLFFGEELLARLDPDHVTVSSITRMLERG
jgi:hypothetical protein